jgi:hypothetical protein
MTDRSRTILDLTEIFGPAANVYFVVETADGTRRVSLQGILSNSSSNVVVSNSQVLSAYTNVNRRKETPVTGTPANTTAGTWYYDDNYLYLATANNFLKKIPLQDF